MTVKRFLVVIVLLGLAAITLGPVGLRPELPLPNQLQRAIGFGVAGMVLGVAFGSRWRWALLIVVVAAGGLELLQLIVPGRDARLLDFVVKTIAGCLGVGFVAATRQMLPLGNPRRARQSDDGRQP